jgi:hypothetical protein
VSRYLNQLLAGPFKGSGEKENQGHLSLNIEIEIYRLDVQTWQSTKQSFRNKSAFDER